MDGNEENNTLQPKIPENRGPYSWIFRLFPLQGLCVPIAHTKQILHEQFVQRNLHMQLCMQSFFFGRRYVCMTHAHAHVGIDKGIYFIKRQQCFAEQIYLVS